MSGVTHFTRRGAIVAYPQGAGLASPARGVAASGVLLVAGTVPDPQMRSSEKAHFFKNVSLAGGALLAFVVVQELGAGLEYALGDPLF